MTDDPWDDAHERMLAPAKRALREHGGDGDLATTAYLVWLRREEPITAMLLGSGVEYGGLLDTRYETLLRAAVQKVIAIAAGE